MMEATEMGEVKDILVAIAKLQVELKGMDKKIDEISRLSNQVQITEQSTKTAHNRIDDLVKHVDVVKSDILDKMKQQKTEFEKELADLEKSYEKELTNIRRDYDKQMLAQDDKWGDRLKPFIEKQQKQESRAAKIEAAVITWTIAAGLGGIVYLIQYFS